MLIIFFVDILPCSKAIIFYAWCLIASVTSEVSSGTLKHVHLGKHQAISTNELYFWKDSVCPGPDLDVAYFLKVLFS